MGAFRPLPPVVPFLERSATDGEGQKCGGSGLFQKPRFLVSVNRLDLGQRIPWAGSDSSGTCGDP